MSLCVCQGETQLGSWGFSCSVDFMLSQSQIEKGGCSGTARGPGGPIKEAGDKG